RTPRSWGSASAGLNCLRFQRQFARDPECDFPDRPAVTAHQGDSRSQKSAAARDMLRAHEARSFADIMKKTRTPVRNKPLYADGGTARTVRHVARQYREVHPS
ncbi:hypothetical protein AB3X93_43735, partial [Paraburkholderia sp. BR14262]|uniref:hypothetical protein n=1 Tax=Paraburkholderia sp. BR14262 TaxID=3236999 RepID=UPI0034CD4F2D